MIVAEAVCAVMSFFILFICESCTLQSAQVSAAAVV